MKALVYGDLQATDGSDRCFNSPTESLQIWRVKKFYSELAQIYKKHRCSAIWDLGDMFDDRSSIPVPALDAVIEGIEQFPASQLNIKLIGNHDQYFRNTSVHSGRMFKPYFQVVGESQIIRWHKTAILCCAYEEDSAVQAKWIADAVDQCYPDEKIVVIGHFQVVGCKMNSGVSLTGVPLEVMSEVNLAILGHVHKPQELSENIHYVGSPFQQDFGEANENKRVGIVDTEACTVEWVPITGFPSYRTVGLNEFMATAKVDSEDRYKVVLTSYEEAEKFYAHPLSTRCEPIYDYKASDDAKAAAVPAQLQGRKDVLLRYLGQATPDTRGVLISVEEMAEFGDQLAEAADA